MAHVERAKRHVVPGRTEVVLRGHGPGHGPLALAFSVGDEDREAIRGAASFLEPRRIESRPKSDQPVHDLGMGGRGEVGEGATLGKPHEVHLVDLI